jgi:hypothetical protein
MCVFLFCIPIFINMHMCAHVLDITLHSTLQCIVKDDVLYSMKRGALELSLLPCSSCVPV